MYTRYIPQPDGSYRRSRIPDSKPKTPSTPPPQLAPPPRSCPCREEHKPPKQPSPEDSSIGGFFRKLLPADFDTSDLLIILLLLLIAGDCPEDKNTALLTMIIYLIQ